MLGNLTTLPSLCSICWTSCFCDAMDMDDTNDGEAVPMTKEAVVRALKGDLLSLDGDGVVVNTKSEAYGRWLLLSAKTMESIMAKGVQSVAGAIGTADHSTVRDAVKEEETRRGGGGGDEEETRRGGGGGDEEETQRPGHHAPRNPPPHRARAHLLLWVHVVLSGI